MIEFKWFKFKEKADNHPEIHVPTGFTREEVEWRNAVIGDFKEHRNRINFIMHVAMFTMICAAFALLFVLLKANDGSL